MPKFKIYYGLGGSFGGAKYASTEEFDTENDAVEYAYDQAVEEYEKYASRLTSYQEVMDAVLKDDPEADEDDIDSAYYQEMERWLSYKVELVIEDKE